MVRTFAYFIILGKPLIFYIGILTLLSFLFTALIGYSFRIGKPILNFKWHFSMAVFSLVLGFIHGFLAASIYFNY